MAEVAPKSSGFFGKFRSVRPKDPATRKLKKRNVERLEINVDPVENKVLIGSPFTQRSSSTSSSLTRTSSFFTPWKTKTQNQRQVPTTQKGPQKLKKLPHQAPQQPVLDKDTGEQKDLTDMMHAFSYTQQDESHEEIFTLEVWEYDPSKPDGASFLARLYPEIWGLVADHLCALDIANLASTCRIMYNRVGRRAYQVLRDPANRVHRLQFLLAMDAKLPGHLFCFPCAQWHIRTSPGLEKMTRPNILAPVFNCPNSMNSLLPPPRIRLTDGRTLPFTLVQLYKRAWEHGTTHGISVQALSRRWKDEEVPWTHESMFHIHTNGHVLIRVKSQIYVEGGMQSSAKRLLLFSRSDYIPYFSVCAHFRNGLLTSIPKCALDHIPVRSVNILNDLRHLKAYGPTPLCSICRPMRRCPDCPTEYLVELKLIEDPSMPRNTPERFKQALLVTRWSDLGPARSPQDPEWASIIGELEGYDSFKETGRRAISGIFESAFTDTLPGQRILSANPDGTKWDEDHGNWY